MDAQAYSPDQKLRATAPIVRQMDQLLREIDAPEPQKSAIWADPRRGTWPGLQLRHADRLVELGADGVGHDLVVRIATGPVEEEDRHRPESYAELVGDLATASDRLRRLGELNGAGTEIAETLGIARCAAVGLPSIGRQPTSFGQRRR